jgi:hypothetical protein
LAYVPKLTRRTSLPARSRPRSYERATSPQNWVMKPRITAEASKVTSKSVTVRTEQQDFLLPHKYFIKHLMGNIRKPPREYDKSEENSSF